MDILKPGEVHLKYALTKSFRKSAEYKDAVKVLSIAEVSRRDGFCFEKDKDLFLLARYLLRKSLSQYYPKISPAEWEFKFNSYGRPYVANDEVASGLYFNLAHSEEMVVCGFASIEEMGVDVENSKRIASYLDLAEHSFAEREAEKVRESNDKTRSLEFFRFWTLKESFIKAKGMGLAIPLDQFWFSISEKHIQIDFDQRMNESASRWGFQLLSPFGPYLVAVALASGGPFLIREEFLFEELNLVP